jgi:hypothetical protein
MVQAVIGQFEEMALTAILALDDRAYGVTTHERVGALAGKTVSLGAIYATLDRLEAAGDLVAGPAARHVRRHRVPRRDQRGRDAGDTGLPRRTLFAEPAGVLRLLAPWGVWTAGCILAGAYGPADKPTRSNPRLLVATVIAALATSALLDVPVGRTAMALAASSGIILVLDLWGARWLDGELRQLDAMEGQL